MTNPVLIVGSNSVLLETRREVLQANGIAVEIRLVKTVPLDLIPSPEITLIVVCSSLSDDARHAIVSSAHAAQLRCLVVEPNANPIRAASSVDATVGAFDGPEKFVHCIHQMISA